MATTTTAFNLQDEECRATFAVFFERNVSMDDRSCTVVTAWKITNNNQPPGHHGNTQSRGGTMGVKDIMANVVWPILIRRHGE